MIHKVYVAEKWKRRFATFLIRLSLGFRFESFLSVPAPWTFEHRLYINWNIDGNAHWVKYKTSLFFRTNLLKANIMFRLSFLSGMQEEGKLHMPKNDNNSSPTKPKWIWKCIQEHEKFPNSDRKLKAAGCRSILALSPSTPKPICMQHMCGLTAKKMWTRLINAFICHVFCVSTRTQRSALFKESNDYQINVCKLVHLMGERERRMINDFTTNSPVASAENSNTLKGLRRNCKRTFPASAWCF